MSQLTFCKHHITRHGTKVVGTLKFGEQQYEAITGGFGLGELPNGRYTVRSRRVDTTVTSGFTAAGIGFFIPIEPQFSTPRHGFGIHPDGNGPGTEGCIGIKPSHVKRFWKQWMDMAISSRPTTIEVTETVGG